jgi:hypothetical protein
MGMAKVMLLLMSHTQFVEHFHGLLLLELHLFLLLLLAVEAGALIIMVVEVAD